MTDQKQNTEKKFNQNKRRSFNNRKFQRRPAHPPVEISNAPIALSEQKTAHIPDVAPGVIRIVPLGGVEEIGKNMTAIEIGDDIIVIDAGMEFAKDTTPGIDYVIPNTRYLEERKHKILLLS